MEFFPDDWMPRAIGLVFGFMGGMLMRNARATAEKSRQALTWSQARGEVIASEVKRSPSSSKPRFRAAVRYRYSVNGQDYESETVFLGGRVATLKKTALATCERYAVGNTPTVYYDPSNPDDSYLENSPSGLNGQMFAGAVAVLIGLLFLLGYLPPKD